MRIPAIIGTIHRRVLINYQADKEVIEKFLPTTFRPKLVKGKAIVGICLIRLKNIRPKGLPFNVGISSENGAHRIAVEWTNNGETEEGVYVPRRDTSSRLNSLAGGRVFPGVDDKDCASEFFKNVSVGYSPDKVGETFDGLELKTKSWEVSPLAVSKVASSFFEDKNVFPDGSITFDNALLMRSIDHEWSSKSSF